MTTSKVLLITPPFTQLNTPYPATAYIKGFLNTQNVASHQADIGIEVINAIFCHSGLASLFAHIAQQGQVYSGNTARIIALAPLYLKTINTVMDFLHHKNPMLAQLICTGNFLPEAARFQQVADLDWAFGAMGIQDKARHLATLYIEDLSDLIIATTDPYFGFSRYAERLSSAAHTFDELHAALCQPNSYIDNITLQILANKIHTQQPTLVAISAPFPGNMYSALRCGLYIKQHYPHIKVCLGGGFANTELRSLSDVRVFQYLDYICLDDGEQPLMQLLAHLAGYIPSFMLKRTFLCEANKVVYANGSLMPDIKQNDVGTPDYSDLPLQDYISVIEVANPMHRLWGDGRWNKLTLAHGCYWGKCTFCDISLPYIKDYEGSSASIIVDRMATIIAQTGNNGFHFVDEAAPPAMMKAVALELLHRQLPVVWWANIRFEKSFSQDLCLLLAASGCIAVSGGLEVASDRLLALIKKGVTVAQVAKVADHFTNAGIMVHAYLMYGFPTQTAQETIDSLEVVRQLFEASVVQSGFWHQFAMTAHSPVGMAPEQFGASKVSQQLGTFANNEIPHHDPTGTQHHRFASGLRKSLYNYMHGMCFDFPLQEWFAHKVPKTTLHPQYIQQLLAQPATATPQPHSRLVWLGAAATCQPTKGSKAGQYQILLTSQRQQQSIAAPAALATWLCQWLQDASPTSNIACTLAHSSSSYQAAGLGSFAHFQNSQYYTQLCDMGLVIV